MPRKRSSIGRSWHLFLIRMPLLRRKFRRWMQRVLLQNFCGIGFAGRAESVQFDQFEQRRAHASPTGSVTELRLHCQQIERRCSQIKVSPRSGVQIITGQCHRTSELLGQRITETVSRIELRTVEQLKTRTIGEAAQWHTFCEMFRQLFFPKYCTISGFPPSSAWIARSHAAPETFRPETRKAPTHPVPPRRISLSLSPIFFDRII